MKEWIHKYFNKGDRVFKVTSSILCAQRILSLRNNELKSLKKIKEFFMISDCTSTNRMAY